jgi:lipoate-protein ligase A
MAESTASPIPVSRWLATTELDGAWQMAIDSWLLEQGQPSFRLYRWRRPTLSLGYHQRQLDSHWANLVEQGVIDLVRRPSGGRAVLHAGDLTYAMVWPNPPMSRQEAYKLSCTWLQLAFETLGLPLCFGEQAADLQRSNCFAISTSADLVHAEGSKRIGSAQLWRQGHLLQHGSILLDPPRCLWQQVFGQEPPALPLLPVGPTQLEQCLVDAAEQALPEALRAALSGASAGATATPLQAHELEEIAARASHHHVSLSRLRSAGTGSLATTSLEPTSPAASIERTTWANPNPSG